MNSFLKKLSRVGRKMIDTGVGALTGGIVDLGELRKTLREKGFNEETIDDFVNQAIAEGKIKGDTGTGIVGDTGVGVSGVRGGLLRQTMGGTFIGDREGETMYPVRQATDYTPLFIVGGLILLLVLIK